jgi:pyruvate formate lyase activating enzyme
LASEDRYIEASFYENINDGNIRCRLCPHYCVIRQNASGFCGARVNRDGVLYAESYGCVSGIGMDPVEKKPLNRFFPGSLILSIGNYGCNLRCPFCQNHSISMRDARGRRINDKNKIVSETNLADLSSDGIHSISAHPSKTFSSPLSADTHRITPEQLAALSLQYSGQFPEENINSFADFTGGAASNIGIAYTYNEPLIGYEFVRDCAALVHAQGQKNVLVTNGYINPEPLRALLPVIDALNIDLKSYSDIFYRNIRGGLEAVKQTIALAAEHAHVEITTLVIPGENDGEAEIDALARFIAGIRPDIPLHLSRFFPNYKMEERKSTPKETMYRLRETAGKHLKYVYLGNMR